MKKESSDYDTNKKRISVRITKNELLKDVPPVAILNINEVNSYFIQNESDVADFIKELKIRDVWVGKEDDLALGIPGLSEGLLFAVKNFCDSLPNVYFEFFGTETSIEERLKVILYLSVCELINNAVKYAFSSNIFVQLIIENDFISVTVYDDGRGFDPETAAIGTGLGNIANAVIACKGYMTIHSSSRGTEINIEIEQ
jgi:signal transduction histidine kinase